MGQLMRPWLVRCRGG